MIILFLDPKGIGTAAAVAATATSFSFCILSLC